MALHTTYPLHLTTVRTNTLKLPYGITQRSHDPGIIQTWDRGFPCDASDFRFGFEIAARTTIPWFRPLPQCNVFFTTSDNGRRRPGEGFGFSFRLGCQQGYHRVWIVCGPIGFVDVLFVDLIFFYRCFQFVLSCTPVHARRVDSSVLCFGLSSHRHSYVGFVFTSRFIDSQ